jgi:hypothetical protein
VVAGAADEVGGRQLGQGPAVAESRRHLLFEAPGVEAVHVVIAVVGKQQAAGLHEPPEVLTLGRRETDQLVTGHEQERKGQQFL